MNRILIIIKSAEDAAYDLYVVAPEGMGVVEAHETANSALSAMKLANPEWESTDVDRALLDVGFEFIQYATADVEV